MNELFPIFLKANQLNILLVGGGEIAHEKLHFLLKSSPAANVKLLANEIRTEIREISARHASVVLQNGQYEKSHLKGVHLVIAATNNAQLNDEIRQDANELNVLLNVADKADLCDFYLGGIVTKGDLKLAISTNGKSPIMAKRIRQFFEAEFPNEIEDVINSLKQLRGKLNGSFGRKLKTLNKLTKNLINENN